MIAWAQGTALLLILASCWGAYQHGRSVERAQASLVAAERASAASRAEARAQRSARAFEQQRAQAQEQVRTHAYEQRQAATAEASAAAAAGQRLQHAAAQLAARAECPGVDTAAATRGKAATRAAMVLSELLARADARAGELAKAYDAARIAGSLCEASYTALARPLE
ncbi:DUF2514 family protein [Pseudomonas cremoricolorata]|uniref:DUF2514 domain-containing protein n=1 Tax=Pseudomonas cremoricolorata TaxID=157783 RepID=A0A089WVZ2_9PSED|nr:DUF2514 family protein [Pseudomonas cremoricolorata]AIR90767.1 hypothetical protein LK03_16495 [Pseudomonas cremoricolorata]